MRSKLEGDEEEEEEDMVIVGQWNFKKLCC